MTQQLTLLPDDGTIAEFTEIVNDMRGQSNQVSVQMGRLAEFENSPSPAGAQILDFSTSITALAEEEYVVASIVKFRAPQDAPAIAIFIQEELRALGWNKSSESVQTLSGGDQTTLVFRLPGIPREVNELIATIEDIPGATMITYDYRAQLVEGQPTLLRFHAWQDALRLPRASQVVASSVRTEDDIGTMTVVHLLNSETAAEARQDVVDLLDEDEFQIITSQDSGTTAAPLLLEDEFGNQLMLEFALGTEPDSVAMTVIHTFDLDPVN